jgi:hypothetical protein
MSDYETGFKITAVLAFFAGWAYAIFAYGFFLGGGLGWIPALLIAVIAGLIWPVLALAVGGVVLFFLIAS